MKTIEVVAGIICDGAWRTAGAKVLATQRGYGDYKDYWEFPGGKMESGETPEQALVRELKEELAVDVLVGDFVCFSPDHALLSMYDCGRKGSGTSGTRSF